MDGGQRGPDTMGIVKVSRQGVSLPFLFSHYFQMFKAINSRIGRGRKWPPQLEKQQST
jgi:hypothetical protein